VDGGQLVRPGDVSLGFDVKASLHGDAPEAISFRLTQEFSRLMLSTQETVQRRKFRFKGAL